MADQAVLEERIEHLQRDVTEIKQDVRRLDEKVDRLGKDMAALDTKFTAAIGSMKTEIAVMFISLIKWMIGTIIAGIGVASAIAFGIAKLMQ